MNRVISFRNMFVSNILMILSFFAFVAPAHAVAVYDTIKVFDKGGGVISSVFATEAELQANPNAIFFVPDVSVNVSLFGQYGIILNEGVAVDIFGIATGGPNGYNLAFSPGGQAASYPLQNVVVATGNPIDLTSYLDTGLIGRGYTAFFSASGNIQIPGAVPEPATWAMMLIGTACIGAAMRRKRAAAVRSLMA